MRVNSRTAALTGKRWHRWLKQSQKLWTRETIALRAQAREVKQDVPDAIKTES